MKIRALAGTVLAFALGGCEAAPKVVQGRKVVGIRWVQGLKVYLLEPAEEDRLATERSLKESADAAKGIVFQSTVNPGK